MSVQLSKVNVCIPELDICVSIVDWVIRSGCGAFRGSVLNIFCCIRHVQGVVCLCMMDWAVFERLVIVLYITSPVSITANVPDCEFPMV